jgi:hypothetical protein
MSDFRLREIAFLARKNSRTIRRYCEAGLVRGAFRIGGKRGHWRIRANSALEAAEQALEATRGFSRNRGSQWEATFRRFAKQAVKIQRKTRPIHLQMVKIERAARRTSRIIRPATRALQLLLEVSDDRLEKIGWSRSALEAVKKQLMQERTATKLIEAALLLLMLEADAQSIEPNQSDIAARLGMPPRQFRQDYAAHWNTAARAFNRMTGGTMTADAGYITSPHGETPGERGEVVFHELADDDEVRKWRSAARQSAGQDD